MQENMNKAQKDVLKIIEERFPEKLKTLANNQIYLLDEDSYSLMMKQKSYFIYEQICQSSSPTFKKYRVFLTCITLVLDVYIIHLGPAAKQYQENIYPKYGAQHILFPMNQTQFQCALLKAAVFKIFATFFPSSSSHLLYKFDLIVDHKYQNAFIPSILIDLQPFLRLRKDQQTSQEYSNLNSEQKVINYAVHQFLSILDFLEYLSIVDMISFAVFVEQQRLTTDPLQVEIQEAEKEEKKQKFFIYISGLANAKFPSYYLQSEMMQLILNPSFNLLAIYSINPTFYKAKSTKLTIKSFQHDLLNISSAFSLIAQLVSSRSETNKQKCLMELYENKKYSKLTLDNQKLLADLLTILHQQMDFESFSILRDKIIKLCMNNPGITQNQERNSANKEDAKKNSPPLSPSLKIKLKKRRSYSQSQKDKQILLTLNINKFRDDNYYALRQMKNQSYSSSQIEQWSDNEQWNRNHSEFKEEKELNKKIYENNNNNEKEKEKEKEKDRNKKGEQAKEKKQDGRKKSFQMVYSYLFKSKIVKEQKYKLKEKKIYNWQKNKCKFTIKTEKYKERADLMFHDKKQNPLNIWLYLNIKSELKILAQSDNLIEFTNQYVIIFLTLQAHHLIKFCQYLWVLSSQCNQQLELNGTYLLKQQNKIALDQLNNLIGLLVQIVSLKFVKKEITNLQSFNDQIVFYTFKYRKMTQIILLNLRYKLQSKIETIKWLSQMEGEFNSEIENLLGRIKNQELYKSIEYREFYEEVITQRNLLYQLENQDYYLHLDNLESYISRTVTLYKDTKELNYFVLKLIGEKRANTTESYIDICFSNIGMNCQICISKNNLFLSLLMTDIFFFVSRFSHYSSIVHDLHANSIKQAQIIYSLYFNYSARLFCNQLFFPTRNSVNSIYKQKYIKSIYEASIFKNILSWHKSYFFAYKYRTQENIVKLMKIQQVLSNLDFNKTSYFWLYNFSLLAIQNSKWTISDRFLYLLKINMTFFSSPMLYYHAFAFQVKYYLGELISMRKSEEWRKTQPKKEKKQVNQQIKNSQIFQDFLNVIKSETRMETQLNPKIIFQLLHTTFKIFQFRQYKLEVQDICIEFVSRKEKQKEIKIKDISVLNIMNQFIGNFKKFEQISALLLEYGNGLLQKIETIYRDEQMQKNVQKMNMYQNIQQYTNDEIVSYLLKSNYQQCEFYMRMILFFTTSDTLYFAKPNQLIQSKKKQKTKEMKKNINNKNNKQIIQQLPFQSKLGQVSAQRFGKIQFYNYMRLLNTVNYLRILNGMICKNYGKGSEDISRYMNRYYRAMSKYKIEICTLQSLYAKVFMKEKNIELEEADNNMETQYLKQLYLKTRKENYLLGFVKHLQFLIKNSNNEWIELLQKAFQNEYIEQDQIIQSYFYYIVSNLPQGYHIRLLQKIKTNSLILFLGIEYLRIHKTTSQNYCQHLELIKQINREIYIMKDEISPAKMKVVSIKLSYLLTKIYKFFDLGKCIYFYYKYQRSLKYFDANTIRNSIKISIYHHLHKLTQDSADFSKSSIKKSLLKNVCFKCSHMFNKNVQPVRVSLHLLHKIRILEQVLQISESQKI